LLADYCAENGVTHIVKGLRNGTDLDSEMAQEWYTKGLNSDVETVYFTTNNTLRYLSSSSIKNLSSMDVNSFVTYMKKVNSIEGASPETMESYLEWVWRNVK
jgi:pantetheine-phosphate adenylyltransferase